MIECRKTNFEQWQCEIALAIPVMSFAIYLAR